MKLFINISLCLVAFSQLCSASIDDSKDKRFPVFNFISSKVNEYFSVELLSESRSKIESWSKYNEDLVSRNQTDIFKTEDYQKLLKSVEQAYEVMVKLEEDKGNCDLRNDLTVKSQDLTIPGYIDTAINMIFMKIPRDRPKFLRATLDEIDEQLPALIANFIEGLDETEREKYKDLVEYGKEYLAAKDKAEKVYVFPRILLLYPTDPEVRDSPCKWSFTNYLIFSMYLKVCNVRTVSNVYRAW